MRSGRPAATSTSNPQETLAILQKRFPHTAPRVVAASFDAMRKAMPLSPALEPKALADGDPINIEAGFIKSTDRLKAYDDLFTNEYVK